MRADLIDDVSPAQGMVNELNRKHKAGLVSEDFGGSLYLSRGSIARMMLAWTSSLTRATLRLWWKLKLSHLLMMTLILRMSPRLWWNHCLRLAALHRALLRDHPLRVAGQHLIIMLVCARCIARWSCKACAHAKALGEAKAAIGEPWVQHVAHCDD